MKIVYLFCCLLLAVMVTPGSAAPGVADGDHAYLRLAQAFDSGVRAAESEDEQLKIAALEGLIAAPSARALPLIEKVLAGNDSNAVKSRALFVLSQIELPAAQAMLLGVVRDASGPLRLEAIRMIGIGGTRESLAQLAEIYRNGDEATRDGVLQAYLIAGDTAAVYALARDAASDEDFAALSRTLAAMGATEELRRLLEQRGDSRGLIEAYAIAGDLQSLRSLAGKTDDPEQRAEAIRSIGIVGGEEGEQALLELYRQAGDEATRAAAREGLLIAGRDAAVLALFRESRDAAEKRELLQTLMHMDSDLVIDVIDSTLEGRQP